MTLPRELAAAALVLGYALFCAVFAWRHRRRQAAVRRERDALSAAPAGIARPPWIVAFASQTGQAEALATRTARALHAGGHPVRLAALAEIGADDLRAAARLFCVAATYGEGDAPDAAAPFVRGCMARDDIDLSHLEVAVLALGDRRYGDFCGFGRRLEDWLRSRGAAPLAGRVDVDRLGDEALARWNALVASLGGRADAGDEPESPLAPWRVVERECLNPGSAALPVHRIALVPDGAAPLPHWEAGDLVRIAPPDDPAETRAYSIASIPEDGRVELVVRAARRPDGSPGRVSGWLATLAAGDRVPLRLVAHRSFRIGANAARPLLLVGAGTGVAGLRAHWRQRVRAAHAAGVAPEQAAPTWLVFGERDGARDAFFDSELRELAAAGRLRVDRVFSRDGAAERHVQHRLAAVAGDIADWLRDDGAVLVCGRLDPMAAEVDRALAAIVGEAALQDLAVAGRYRRDAY